jgi:RND superfamily putative drug exporter
MSRPSEPSPITSRRRSRTTLIAWGIAIAVLTVLGHNVAGRLSPMSLEVPGTPSSRAEALLRARFGNTIPIAILLRGPSAQTDREGRALVAALRTQRDTQVLSPWDASAAMTSATMRSLRPEPGTAFVLVDYVRPASQALAIVPGTERIVARTVRTPVRSYLTGVAVIGRAIQQSTLADTERAEMIALPVLIVVLLLVFGSPVAAAVPLAMGAATVLAGHGLLWLASFLTPINSLGVAIAAMMSLALGVDYALLMVSRVRQELSAGADHEAAVTIAAHHAGRTIVAAGGTLALTMLAASAVATPGLLGPVAIGVVISGLLSVALAVTAMPALLRLLGPRLNAWQIGRRHAGAAPRRGGAAALAERLISHPAITAPLILGAMLALAAPTRALRLGPPDASELPASNPARHAVAMVQRAIGPGWAAPFVIVANARSGAITSPAQLRALMRWQETIARAPDVAAVLGPASVAGAQLKLAEAHAALASAPARLQGARRGIDGLRSGLREAGGGVARLHAGLGTAAAGAGALGEADARASNGAWQSASGAARAQHGAGRIASATARAHAGAGKLARESARAHRGARRLARETDRAQRGAGALNTGAGRAADGSRQLAGGLDEAAAGAQRLAASDHELADGAAELAEGIDTLDTTVHAILAPIEPLVAELGTWADRLAALQESGHLLTERIREAARELRAMTAPRGDPRYQALARDLAALEQMIEQDGISQLTILEQQLLAGLRMLAGLPAELSQLTSALDRLTAGADRLASGTRASEQGALQLSSGLHRLAAGGHSLSDGLGALQDATGRLAGGLGRLATGNRQLASGLGRLTAGDARLAGGLGGLTAGDARLAGGLGRLTAGDARLAGGLGRLTAGDARLASGLSSAVARTGRLAAGLGGARAPLARYATMLAGYQRDYQLLHSDAPHAIDSGYLVLTALDGTVAPVREQVAQLVNVDGGGQAARIMVVAASPPGAPATAALSARLRRSLPQLAAATGGDVEIGQGAQYLLDYKNANTARVPWLVLALALVATLTLILVLRALPLALLAVALNMATIAVALGSLQLLTERHVLGGPGYIDAASGAGILAIMFVLSIDYEVFLLTRMREHWLAEHDARGAIAHGLRHTAGVITGSAAIMTAVFVAFAGAGVIPLRQFGVGLTIAVLLDATIVRLVLLPALMRIVGARIWWLPRWLERRLPAVEAGTSSSTEMRVSASR